MVRKQQKHRKKRGVTAEKLVICFFVVFVLSLVVVFPMMVSSGKKQLEDAAAQKEAERIARLDTSWLQGDYSLNWIGTQGLAEMDDQGEEFFVYNGRMLRSFNFADGTFSDVPLAETEGSLSLIPSDAPDGFVLAELQDWELCTIHTRNADGSITPKSFEIMDFGYRGVYAWYEEKLYFSAKRKADETEDYPWSGWEALYCMGVWDSRSGEVRHYRSHTPFCLAADGSAVLMQARSTGIMESAGFRYDEDGKRTEKFEEVPGWTLGEEDAQGNWTVFFPVGDDSSLKDVYCAAWLDDDRLLLAARTTEVTYNSIAELYVYTRSTGELAPWMDANAQVMQIGSEKYTPWNYMTLSPDGKYLACFASSPGFKGDYYSIMVQDLQTGRWCIIAPQDPVTLQEQRVDDSPQEEYFGGLLWAENNKENAT